MAEFSTYLRNRARSFAFAGSGIRRLLREERNARLHAVGTILVGLVGIWCRLSRLEWALIAMTVTAVWAAEAANSAVERLADAVTVERRPLIGAAKDLAAASVLFVAIGAVIVGLLIFGSHLTVACRSQ